MTLPPAHTQQPRHAPGWIFPWRAPRTLWLPKFIALAFATTGFALLITSVRVQLVRPEKSSPRKASLIYLGNDPQSRALALRAQEGGPFPSRFDPSTWPSLAESERLAMDAASFRPPPYHPVVAELPEENLAAALVLAPQGKAFFPQRPPASVPESPTATGHSLVPQLHPLSDAAATIMPASLPPFTVPVDSVMTSSNWRFIICVAPAGNVSHCVSLGKGGETAADALTNWLRQIHFPAATENKDRWTSLAINFTHLADHGPNTQ